MKYQTKFKLEQYDGISFEENEVEMRFYNYGENPVEIVIDMKSGRKKNR